VIDQVGAPHIHTALCEAIDRLRPFGRAQEQRSGIRRTAPVAGPTGLAWWIASKAAAGWRDVGDAACISQTYFDEIEPPLRRLSRASTSCLCTFSEKDVDGRDKPGHDSGEVVQYATNRSRKSPAD
jgi:hypothetical protein